jgi:RNA polymerase-binding transcription factor DksA
MPARRVTKKPSRATPAAQTAAPLSRRPAARRAAAKKPVLRSARAATNAAQPQAAPAPAPVVRARGLSGPKLEPYVKRLTDERRRLRQELSEMEQHQVKTEEKPVADVSGSYDDDLVDVATETFEREKGLALESSVQGMLQMVEEALRRTRSGTYGVCDGCGRLIDANRLRAIPYARLCIKCKEREERLRSVLR